MKWVVLLGVFAFTHVFTDTTRGTELCFFSAHFNLTMVSTDRCAGTVLRITNCENDELAKRILRIYGYVKAIGTHNFESACSKNTVRDMCAADYNQVTVQPIDGTVPDPVTGKPVGACQWSAKEEMISCESRPINESGIKALERADIIPYFNFNGTPIICDAPNPPAPGH